MSTKSVLMSAPISLNLSVVGRSSVFNKPRVVNIYKVQRNYIQMPHQLNLAAQTDLLLWVFDPLLRSSNSYYREVSANLFAASSLGRSGAG